jgi:hypothetical protein
MDLSVVEEVRLTSFKSLAGAVLSPDDLTLVVGRLDGEWLLVTHSIPYDSLPSYLVALDLWSAEAGFAGVDQRNELGAESGLCTPPEVWRGVAHSVDELEARCGRAAWSQELMEGVVLRRLGSGAPPVGKLLRPGFTRVDDDLWRQGRPRNRLATGRGTWS